MITTNKRARFRLGQTVATPGVLEVLKSNGQNSVEFLCRHQRLEPGTLCEEDQQANEEAVTNGDRIFSSYLLKDGTKIWVITEADRSSTCVLLPEEY